MQLYSILQIHSKTTLFNYAKSLTIPYINLEYKFESL